MDGIHVARMLPSSCTDPNPNIVRTVNSSALIFSNLLCSCYVGIYYAVVMEMVHEVKPDDRIQSI